MSEKTALQPYLARIAAGASLDEAAAHEAFAIIMTGEAAEAQIGALLLGIEARGGPTIAEITGAARVMREHVARVSVPEGMEVIDTCGTGGDHTGTFNISTASALIAAGAGARVAKHGNRSVTSKSGSSQVLEALGVNLQAAPETLTKCLVEAGLCFCFAPAHHPAMKHAIATRRALGVRTIFNVLGPLTNPAGATRQVMGVFADTLTEPIAQVLKNLGATKAMVVHGKSIASPDLTEGGSGLDEIATTGPTQITLLADGQISTSSFHPADLGMTLSSLKELQVDSVEASAAVIRQILKGQPGPATDIACLNAAAALVIADLATDLKDGFAKAKQACANGSAHHVLETLVNITQAG